MEKHKKGYFSKKTFVLGLILLAVVSNFAMVYPYIHRSFTLAANTTLSQFANISRNWAHTLIRAAMKSENSGDVAGVYSGNDGGIKHRSCTKSFKDTHLMTISYSGRTGNILFQFATLLVVANSTCYTAVRKTETIKGFDDVFDLDNVRRMAYGRASFKELPEPGSTMYDENITSRILPEYNWILNGYRQSYRYFENYSNWIRSSFRFKDAIKARVADFLKNTLSHDRVIKVGVHVRRSDMIREQNATKVKRVSDTSFIQNAIAYMRQRLGAAGNVSFVVISDAISWCKDNVKVADVVYSPFGHHGEDLYLLMQCDHHIITSGTFGWMGAWLNESGIVVYDESMMRFPNGTYRKGFNPSDYYPSRWVGL